MGMTNTPTSRSATAKDIRKKLVAFWSFLSNDTARMTRMFPPMVGMMTKTISNAAQRSRSPNWEYVPSPLHVGLSSSNASRWDMMLWLVVLLRRVVLRLFPEAWPALSQSPSDQRVVVGSVQLTLYHSLEIRIVSNNFTFFVLLFVHVHAESFVLGSGSFNLESESRQTRYRPFVLLCLHHWRNTRGNINVGGLVLSLNTFLNFSSRRWKRCMMNKVSLFVMVTI